VSPQAQAAILAYCQEAMTHLNLMESGIFTYSDLERQLVRSNIFFQLVRFSPKFHTFVFYLSI
jgi:hypothetical protein